MNRVTETYLQVKLAHTTAISNIVDLVFIMNFNVSNNMCIEVTS